MGQEAEAISALEGPLRLGRSAFYTPQLKAMPSRDARESPPLLSSLRKLEKPPVTKRQKCIRRRAGQEGMKRDLGSPVAIWDWIGFEAIQYGAQREGM